MKEIKDRWYYLVFIIILTTSIIVLNIYKTNLNNVLSDYKIGISTKKNIYVNQKVEIKKYEEEINKYYQSKESINEKVISYESHIEELENEITNYNITIVELREKLNDLRDNYDYTKKTCSNPVIRDVRDVFRYLDYKKDDIIARFGDKDLVSYNDCAKSLEYKDIGLTFIFNCDNPNIVEMIKLGHQIDIDGVSARMNLNDIVFYFDLMFDKNIKIIKESDERYIINYEIDDYVITFSNYYYDGKLSEAILTKEK